MPVEVQGAVEVVDGRRRERGDARVAGEAALDGGQDVRQGAGAAAGGRPRERGGLAGGVSAVGADD